MVKKLFGEAVVSEAVAGEAVAGEAVARTSHSSYTIHRGGR